MANALDYLTAGGSDDPNASPLQALLSAPQFQAPPDPSPSSNPLTQAVTTPPPDDNSLEGWLAKAKAYLMTGALGSGNFPAQDFVSGGRSTGSVVADKLLGAAGTPRYQLWPERMIRSGATAASDALSGNLPDLAMDPTTGELHTSPQMIERAMDMTALAGSGGIGGAEAGAVGVFGGKLSKLADHGAIAKAEEMEAAGTNPDRIWKETGTARGADGKWRQEIDDSAAKLKIPPSKLEQGHYLDEVIDHPELFQAYPHLKDVQVSPLPKSIAKTGVQGDYQAGTSTIRLNKNLSPDEAKSALLHETQHAVQTAEGFAPGDNPANHIPPKLGPARQNFEKVRADTHADVAKTLDTNGAGVEFMKDLIRREKYGPEATRSVFTPFLVEMFQKKLADNPDIRSRLSNIVESEQLLKEADQRAHAAYRASMGETEARNVQSRAGYGPGNGAAIHPIYSEDVPRAQQLGPRFNSDTSKEGAVISGLTKSADPFKVGAPNIGARPTMAETPKNAPALEPIKGLEQALPTLKSAEKIEGTPEQWAQHFAQLPEIKGALALPEFRQSLGPTGKATGAEVSEFLKKVQAIPDSTSTDVAGFLKQADPTAMDRRSFVRGLVSTIANAPRIVKFVGKAMEAAPKVAEAIAAPKIKLVNPSAAIRYGMSPEHEKQLLGFVRDEMMDAEGYNPKEAMREAHHMWRSDPDQTMEDFGPDVYDYEDYKDDQSFTPEEWRNLGDLVDFGHRYPSGTKFEIPKPLRVTEPVPRTTSIETSGGWKATSLGRNDMWSIHNAMGDDIGMAGGKTEDEALSNFKDILERRKQTVVKHSSQEVTSYRTHDGQTFPTRKAAMDHHAELEKQGYDPVALPQKYNTAQWEVKQRAPGYWDIRDPSLPDRTGAPGMGRSDGRDIAYAVPAKTREEAISEALKSMGVLKSDTSKEGAAIAALKPAMKIGEKIYKGEPGEAHIDILTRAIDEGLNVMGSKDGFVNDRGHFLNRKAAGEYALDNDLVQPQYRNIVKRGGLTSEHLRSDTSKEGAAIAALKSTPGRQLRPAMAYQGRVYKAKVGQEHADALPPAMHADFMDKAMKGTDLAEYKTGFVDHQGRFLSREAALDYAIKEGLVDPSAARYGMLTTSLLADSSKPGTAIEALAKTRSPFYSAVEHAVGNAPQDTMQGAQWAGWLKNQPGVKKEELDWTGVHDWLSKQKGQVRKSDVQAYLDEHKVDLKDVTKGGPPADDTVLDELHDKGTEAVIDAFHAKYPRMVGKEHTERYQNALEAFEESPEGEAAYNAVLQSGFDREGQAPKYSEYQLPGGENYREHLLTMPEKKPPGIQELQDRMDRHGSREDFRVGDIPNEGALNHREFEALRHWNNQQPANAGYRSSHWDEPNVLAHVRTNDRTMQVDAPQWKLRNKTSGNTGKAFDSEEAALAHREKLPEKLRPNLEPVKVGDTKPVDRQRYNELSERYNKDGKLPQKEYDEWTELSDQMHGEGHQGKKALHIEEIQSDWHQKGRKYGYKSDESEAEYQRLNSELQKAQEAASKRASELSSKITEKDLDNDSRYPINDFYAKDATYRELRAKADELEAQRSRVHPVNLAPDAPFKTSWPELALKRMIRHAAENGYDRISWTPGEAQAARYDLSKQVDAVRYIQHGGDKFSAMADKDGRTIVAVDRQPLSEIEKTFGKEVAEKIANKKEPEGYLRGLDLRVGGEGMKEFYDKMLPKMVEKIGKAHGVKVKTTNIVKPETKLSYEELQRRRSGEKPDPSQFEQPVHYFDLPQSLKDQALHRGFPLFAKGIPFPLTPVDNDPFKDKAR